MPYILCSWHWRDQRDGFEKKDAKVFMEIPTSQISIAYSGHIVCANRR